MNKEKEIKILFIGKQLATLSYQLELPFSLFFLSSSDAIPSDISLLVISSDQAFQLIPTLPKRIPWILVTPKLEQSTIKKATDLNCSDFICGELHPEEISWRINHLLQQEAMRDRLQCERDNLKELSERDPLTQLLNRRGFSHHALCALIRAKRRQHPIALFSIDVDHFKNINDTHGHPFGDQVLCHYATIIKRVVRAYDLIGRVGGDEFSIFLSDISRENSYKVASQLIRLFNNTTLSSTTGYIPLKASIGIATLSKYPFFSFENTTVFDLLLHHADLALYDAKHAGRNRLALRPVVLDALTPQGELR